MVFLGFESRHVSCFSAMSGRSELRMEVAAAQLELGKSSTADLHMGARLLTKRNALDMFVAYSMNCSGTWSHRPPLPAKFTY